MADDYLRRTAITRPILTDEQQDLLDATISEWKDTCNISSRIGWDAGETRKTYLQDLAYDTVLEETHLGSQHAILATHQTAAALDGVEAIEDLGEHYKTSRPEFTSNTVKYDTRTMTLFDDGSVSLSTIESRIRCDQNLLDEEDGYQHEYLNDDEWEVTESTLSKGDGEYYLHLGFRKDKPEKQVETQGDDEDRTVLGVDLGIVNIATTSTAYFASGRELRHRHREFKRIRGNLQQTGTQSAHRTIQQLSGRESRYLRDHLHQVANQILEEARTHDCEYIAFENLKHIQNADYVGAKNVGWRYVRRGLQSSRRTGDSQLALKSGTVTPNRGFVPSD